MIIYDQDIKENVVILFNGVSLESFLQLPIDFKIPDVSTKKHRNINRKCLCTMIFKNHFDPFACFLVPFPSLLCV